MFVVPATLPLDVTVMVPLPVLPYATVRVVGDTETVVPAAATVNVVVADPVVYVLSP